jgi:hypothetical protein
LAKLPIEIHCFAPLITQPPSVFFARVCWLAASEPVPGSVRPKQPSASPLQSCGSHSRFWSSLPQRTIDEQTSEVWTDTTVRIAESARPISSTNSP